MVTTTNQREVFLPRRGKFVSSLTNPQLVRSTVIDSWRWMWPDILMRILPMTAIPFVYILVFGLPLSFLGITFNNVPEQLLVGLLVGIGMTAFAIAYRMYVVSTRFRWPTTRDQAFQSFFYLFINAPVEELFFRGFMLEVITYWSGNLFLGWFISTAAYTLYHRLGKWNWRSVGGVGLAGVIFSLVYLFPPSSHSLIAVIIVHGFTTSGFLSWGDEFLYRRWKRIQQKTLPALAER